MHDSIPYGRNQGQGQGHSREVYRQSPTGLIFKIEIRVRVLTPMCVLHTAWQAHFYCEQVERGLGVHLVTFLACFMHAC